MPWRSTIQKSCNSFSAEEEENRTRRHSNCTDTGKLRHFTRSHNTTAMQTYTHNVKKEISIWHTLRP